MSKDFEMRLNGLLLIAGVVTLGVAPSVEAQVQMPDAKQMSGVPLPVAELPDGSISIRLIRGALSNNIPNHAVELRAGDKTFTQKTDESGRARFDGIPAGTQVVASATVDGEVLSSAPFAVPARGGVRMMLVATAKAGSEDAPAPEQQKPQPGIVVLGPQTRFVIEMGDEALRVFGLVEIRNNARFPVVTSKPLVFETPGAGRGTTVLEGSSPQAKAEGPRVTVTGPFAPGATLAQFAYELPYTGGNVQIVHNIPAALNQLSVILEQPLDDMRIDSPQLSTHGHETVEGRRYLVAGGGAIAAGSSFTLNVSGLPHHSPIPRYVALTLAGLILLGGGIAAFTGRGTQSPDTKRLAMRRDALFADLVKLEEQRQAGRVAEAKYAARRRDLIVQLEQVYTALDEEGVSRDSGATARVRRSA
jgi:hypothetical protein